MKFSPETHDFAPNGYNVLIKIHDVEEVSDGGIILNTKSEGKREQGGHDIGTVVAFGPTSFMAYEGCDGDTAEERAAKWGVRTGDIVQIERYQGKLLDCSGFENYRVVTDNYLMGTFKEKDNA